MLYTNESKKSHAHTNLVINVRNSWEGGFPPISMSIPLAKHVDSMILKQLCMVGSCPHSSRSRWYDSSRRPVAPADGNHTDEENDARDPPCADEAGPLDMAFCMKMLIA
jgi:hypothetical protein